MPASRVIPAHPTDSNSKHDDLYHPRADVDPTIEQVVLVTSRAYDVRDYDGADDAARFQAAIDAASLAGGGRVLAPGAAYDFTSQTVSIDVPSDVWIEGNGGVITAKAGITFPVFDFDAVSNARLSSLRFVKASGASASSVGHAVRIRGDAEDITISDVDAAEFVNGVCIDGSAGTTPGTCRRITLERVRANESPGNWGIGLEECDIVTLTDCHARLNWLDGIKLRAKTSNVTINGGSGTFNGQGYLSDPVLYAGDGIDVYAGGDTVNISDFVADDNYGNGITVKTGDLTRDDPSTYGYVRNATLSNIRASRNMSSGLSLGTSGLSPAEPLVVNLRVDGGFFSENGSNGILCGARGATIDSPLCWRNTTNGIFVPIYGLDTTILGAVCIGNGYPVAASGRGIHIDGRNGYIAGCITIGRDADTITAEADYSGTIYSTQGIFFNTNAVGTWVLSHNTIRHCTINYAYAQDADPVVLVDTSGTGNPAIHGSPGSTYRRTDTTNAEDQMWVKAGNTAVNATTGWVRRTQFTSRTSLPTPAATYLGQPILLDATSVEDSAWVEIGDSAGTAWRFVQITPPSPYAKTATFTADAQSAVYLVDATSGAVTANLPTAVGNASRQYTIKKNDNVNNVVVDPNSSQTIDGAATKTITTQFGHITIVSDGANWHIISQSGTIT